MLRLLFNGCFIRDGPGSSNTDNRGVFHSVSVCGAVVFVFIVSSLNIGGEGASSDPQWMLRPRCCILGMHHCVCFRFMMDLHPFVPGFQLRCAPQKAPPVPPPRPREPQAFGGPWPRSPRSERRSPCRWGCNQIPRAPAPRDPLRARAVWPRLHRDPPVHPRQKNGGFVR